MAMEKRDQDIWKTALDRAKLGLWDWDLASGTCFYSATWAQMLGYREDELAHDADLWLQLTHPEDREQAVSSGERHLSGQTDIIETELRLKHKDGHWVWVLDRGGVIERDEDGKPLRMVGVQTDITRQKLAEYQLEQINARFKLALAASGIGVWHFDMATEQSHWDEKTREIFGIDGSSPEVPRDAWHGYLHPEDKERAERAHDLGPDSGDVTAVRYRIVRRDGEVRHVESLLRFVETAGAAGQILGTVRDVTEKVLHDEELAHAARHDPLTGLLNRIAFDRLFAEQVALARHLPLAVFYIDLDYFKALNDFAGHAAGDAALRAIAAAIRAVLPAEGYGGRLGGDEFAAIVPRCEGREAETLGNALLAAIRTADLGVAVGHRRLAASIGIAIVRDSTLSAADALACADDACYAAKAAGRNRCAVFTHDPDTAVGGLNAARMAAETLDALDTGRLVLYGQRVRQLGDSRFDGAEILARLVGRDGRLIPPGEFIPAAERFGIAAKLDRWIITTALQRYASVMASSGLVLGFNLSAQTLSDPQLWPFVDRLIDETGAPPQKIVFEITETAAVTNFDAAERFVRGARGRQCLVALDDFGSGLSSFEYLRRFPIDTIKINGSFIQHMAESKFDREIVGAINGIAKSLGYMVVAEHIENQETLDMLVDMGVEFGQGYFLHRPEPLENIVDEHIGLAAARRARKTQPG
ncbi:MAG: EAL domain-containing protein [Rhizobiaceae bacterium]|nr:MAG: EAL domain-containing protein [Rhizobiaceae bacterium]CAG0954922.1 Cyclic di-GMP phosphodiesterase PdeB [Rhizobiaceae bacterium]